MEVKLYSTGCPKCSILKSKLDNKGIEYTLIDNKEKVVKFAKEHNIMSAPILVVNGEVMKFSDASNWLNDLTKVSCEEECIF